MQTYLPAKVTGRPSYRGVAAVFGSSTKPTKFDRTGQCDRGDTTRPPNPERLHLRLIAAAPHVHYRRSESMISSGKPIAKVTAPRIVKTSTKVRVARLTVYQSGSAAPSFMKQIWCIQPRRRSWMILSPFLIGRRQLMHGCSCLARMTRILSSRIRRVLQAALNANALGVAVTGVLQPPAMGAGTGVAEAEEAR